MPATRLASINLLPKDLFEFSSLGKTLRWTLSVGRVLVVLTEFVVILAFGSRFYFDKKYNDLIEVVDQKQAVVESYAEIEKQARDVFARQQVVGNYLDNNLQIDKKILRMIGLTPVDVKYDDISINDKGISLTGSAGSEGSLASLLFGLNNLPNIERINVGEIGFDQRDGVVKFKLSVDLGKTKT